MLMCPYKGHGEYDTENLEQFLNERKLEVENSSINHKENLNINVTSDRLEFLPGNNFLNSKEN
jgi:hypothetical protein